MDIARTVGTGFLSILLVATASLAVGEEVDPGMSGTTPVWIWNPLQKHGEVPGGACFFRRSFDLESVEPATLDIAADDRFEVFVNGQPVGHGNNWKHFRRFDITAMLRPGKNSLAVKVVNREHGHAGLAARLNLGSKIIRTDKTWKCSSIALSKWHYARFADASWKSVAELGTWGETKPWIVRELPSAAKLAETKSASASAGIEYHEDPAVQPAGWTEKFAEKAPLLLKPMERSIPWLKKDRSRRIEFDTDRMPIPPVTGIGSQAPPSTVMRPTDEPVPKSPTAPARASEVPTPTSQNEVATKPARRGPKTINNPFVNGGGSSPVARTEQDIELPIPPESIPRTARSENVMRPEAQHGSGTRSDSAQREWSQNSVGNAVADHGR